MEDKGTADKDDIDDMKPMRLCMLVDASQVPRCVISSRRCSREVNMSNKTYGPTWTKVSRANQNPSSNVPARVP